MKNIITRRDFIKKAGLVTLALASGAGLSGCATSNILNPVYKALGRDTTNYDFNKIAEEYENNPIQINSIDDFFLSGEEKGTMRLCELWEKKTIPMTSPNPMKGNSSLYSLGSGVVKVPFCEEWGIAEYIGKTHYSDRKGEYNLDIIANKFKSKEDCIETEEKLKEWYKTTNFSSKGRTYSKTPFIVVFSTGLFIDEAHKQEHIARANLYQKKRGLDLVCGNF